MSEQFLVSQKGVYMLYEWEMAEDKEAIRLKYAPNQSMEDFEQEIDITKFIFMQGVLSESKFKSNRSKAKKSVKKMAKKSRKKNRH